MSENEWWRKHVMTDEEEAAEERIILEALEKGTLKRAEDADELMAMAKKAAENYLKKDSRINIRLPQGDVGKIKEIAMEEGLPYQTLIASVIHKYITGRLVDIANLKRLDPNT